MLDIVRLDRVVGDADLDRVVDRALHGHEQLEERRGCGAHPGVSAKSWKDGCGVYKLGRKKAGPM